MHLNYESRKITIIILLCVIVVSVCFALFSLFVFLQPKVASNYHTITPVQVPTHVHTITPVQAEKLGHKYANPMYSHRNYVKADYWFAQAAKQGYAPAEKSLGSAYLWGNGVPSNNAKAHYWLSKAYHAGDYDAAYGLGYCAGGLPKGLHWFEIAARHGDYGAEHALASAYYSGKQIPRDPAKGAYWLKKLSAQGSEWADLRLGEAYYKGDGVPQNSMKAVALWKIIVGHHKTAWRHYVRRAKADIRHAELG